MADSRTRATDATEPETPKEAAKAAAEHVPDDEPSYDKERIIDEAYAFVGQPSYVVAGALSTITKKNLTKAEVEAAVKAFLATEVS